MPSGDTTWRDALLLDAPCIAGLQVRPLSAWHCHVAQLLGVWLGECDDGRGPTPGSVAQAIVICRSVYRPGAAGIPVPGWWLRRVYLPVRWCFVDWREDASHLVRYVAAYRRYPEIVRQEERASVPLGCPPYFANAVDVATRLPSMSLADALNMPLLSLYCLRAALSELSGGLACAWGTVASEEEIKTAFAVAQAAIDRHNARKADAHA